MKLPVSLAREREFEQLKHSFISAVAWINSSAKRTNNTSVLGVFPKKYSSWGPKDLFLKEKLKILLQQILSHFKFSRLSGLFIKKDRFRVNTMLHYGDFQFALALAQTSDDWSTFDSNGATISLHYPEARVVDFGFRGNECKFVNVPVNNGKPPKGTQSAKEAVNISKIFLVETQTQTIIFCNQHL